MVIFHSYVKLPEGNDDGYYMVIIWIMMMVNMWFMMMVNDGITGWWFFALPL